MIYQHICEQLGLGRMLEPPRMLSGGYTHRMAALTTNQGRYAVKLLNEEIMRRPDALDNFRRAEAFERLLEQQGLPILPALSIGGRKMQQVSGRYLYVFDYFDGHPLHDGDITPAHSREMGAVLARIHQVVRRPAVPETFVPIEWAPLADALLARDDTYREGRMLADALPMLTRVTRAAVDAQHRLSQEQALCHNDMDAKNVLWQGGAYRIIDLECLGWAHPGQEMMDLAISWGGWPLKEACFRAFVDAYRAEGGAGTEEPAVLFDSRWNHLEWLAYNARRSLEADPQERAMGRSQIALTLEKIAGDQACRAQLLAWMERRGTPSVS